MKKLLSIALVLAILLTNLMVPAKAQGDKIFQNTVFAIEGVSTEPDPLTGGDKFVLSFTVRNQSNFDLTGVKVSLREIGPDKTNKFFVLDDAVEGNSPVRSFDMTTGEAYGVQFALQANCQLGCGAYPITLSLQVGENEYVDRIKLDIFKDTQVIEPGVSDGPDGTDVLAGELPILPADKDPSKDPNVPIEPEKPAEPQEPEKPTEPEKPADPVVPTLPAPPADVPAADIPFSPSIPLGGGDIGSGNGGSGGVSLSGDTTGDKIKNKPKLIIDKYTLSPENPLAGEEFTMNLSFYNTNADKGVRNIKIYLTSDDAAVSATNTQAVSSSVFTPVNSSNTFYIGYIAPWNTVQKAITLTTSSTLAAKNYQVTANFEYEDADGNEYTAKELIGIPIVQKSRLQTSEMTLPTEAYLGQPVDASIEFYNTGKDTLYNLMVKLDGDFDSSNKQYYVGNFQSGTSDSYQLDFTPKNPGENKGKIIFTYEDSTGAEQTMEKDFALVVQDGAPVDPNMPPEGEMPPEMMDQQQPSLLSNPIVLAAAALVVAGLGIFFYKRHKKKKEQEDLTIDEDE
ncbi:MAG: hypothetical protein Q4G61_00485 [Tissierellia bacterium]|nr:hypothetical protein [Tissierellia bacterium]